jgi:hypothetical protein
MAPGALLAPAEAYDLRRKQWQKCFHDVLVTGGPKAGLKWLAQPSARTVVDALTDGTCPLTHKGLDALVPNKSVAYLRAALATAAAAGSRGLGLDQPGRRPWAKGQERCFLRGRGPRVRSASLFSRGG